MGHFLPCYLMLPHSEKPFYLRFWTRCLKFLKPIWVEVKKYKFFRNYVGLLTTSLIGLQKLTMIGTISPFSRVQKAYNNCYYKGIWIGAYSLKERWQDSNVGNRHEETKIRQ